MAIEFELKKVRKPRQKVKIKTEVREIELTGEEWRWIVYLLRHSLKFSLQNPSAIKITKDILDKNGEGYEF
jgi:sulfur relay (sulfurtransferase) DsrC/TusE family protein